MDITYRLIHKNIGYFLSIYTYKNILLVYTQKYGQHLSKSTNTHKYDCYTRIVFTNKKLNQRNVNSTSPTKMLFALSVQHKNCNTSTSQLINIRLIWATWK